MRFDGFLQRMFRVGDLTVTFEDGRIVRLGDGDGPPVAARVSNKAALRIARNKSLGLGESYMDGELTLTQGTIWDLVETAGRNDVQRPPKGRPSAYKLLRRRVKRAIEQANQRTASRRNVAHHYDIGNDLYRLFLDEDLQYSCAYWPSLDLTLEQAQVAKKAHIAAKLDLRPGMRVLDIGCGWGGMGLTLARDHGAVVTGVTLSTEQLAVAQQRAAAAGLADRARFELTDYRDVAGPFDRIVSVGMFEHVGLPNYDAFFDKVRDLLTDDGVALIHSIGRMEGPRVTNRFTAKYVFPGGYVPALSEVLPAVERAQLWPTDVEVLRLHYAETIKHWRERFAANRDVALALYDERFCRMWEFYLAGSELAFRYAGHMNFQLQLTKRVGALPITRDYMVDGERDALAPAQAVGFAAMA